MNNLLIIEKYEEFVNYVYPVVQNIDRKHGYVKRKFIDLIFQQVDIFYKAINTSQKSRLYEADGNLASIRFYLRFLANDKRKLLSKKQQQVCEIKLAEVGSILNSWIKK